jgi:hypothetical protein
MPWKASSVMEERLLFVGRLLDGESMSDVCREFGISRKTSTERLTDALGRWPDIRSEPAPLGPPSV